MKVLIVEDEPTCRLALKITLAKWDYEVVVAENCEQAWEIIQQPDTPRLIMLDWLMPGMDGVQLCRKIRQQADLGYFYIIMLTVRKRQEDVVACIEAGADDYVVKPFKKDELRESVATGARRVIADYTTDTSEGKTKKQAILTHYASQMRQLSEQQSAHQLHLDRMATVGIMSAEIAHEINNPTSYVLGSARNLKLFWEEIEPILQTQADETDAEQKKSLEFVLSRIQANLGAICSGLERILNITDSLKAFSHIGQGKRSLCDINTCVLHSLEFCRNALKHNIAVEKKLSRSLPRVMADALQIEQVFINLLVNAADAMSDQQHGVLRIKTSNKQDNVIITVSDTGPGIPDNDLDNIWKPFFTTKPVGKGTGLGLATCKKIIENHSGRIEVTNRSGGGAEFSITLPAASSAAEQSQPVPQTAGSSR